MSKSGLRRLQKEMAEFDDKCYLTEFKKAEKLTDNIVAVTDYDGITWIVERNLNFFEPPIVMRNGEEVKADPWWPCLTSVRWLLMVMNCEQICLPGNVIG